MRFLCQEEPCTLPDTTGQVRGMFRATGLELQEPTFPAVRAAAKPLHSLSQIAPCGWQALTAEPPASGREARKQLSQGAERSRQFSSPKGRCTPRVNRTNRRVSGSIQQRRRLPLKDRRALLRIRSWSGEGRCTLLGRTRQRVTTFSAPGQTQHERISPIRPKASRSILLS